MIRNGIQPTIYEAVVGSMITQFQPASSKPPAIPKVQYADTYIGQYQLSHEALLAI